MDGWALCPAVRCRGEEGGEGSDAARSEGRGEGVQGRRRDSKAAHDESYMYGATQFLSDDSIAQAIADSDTLAQKQKTTHNC